MGKIGFQLTKVCRLIKKERIIKEDTLLWLLQLLLLQVLERWNEQVELQPTVKTEAPVNPTSLTTGNHVCADRCLLSSGFLFLFNLLKCVLNL